MTTILYQKHTYHIAKQHFNLSTFLLIDCLDKFILEAITVNDGFGSSISILIILASFDFIFPRATNSSIFKAKSAGTFSDSRVSTVFSISFIPKLSSFLFFNGFMCSSSSYFPIHSTEQKYVCLYPFHHSESWFINSGSNHFPHIPHLHSFSILSFHSAWRGYCPLIVTYKILRPRRSSRQPRRRTRRYNISSLPGNPRQPEPRIRF